MTKMEDDQNGRQPKWKTIKIAEIKIDEDPHGRLPKWKTT